MRRCGALTPPQICPKANLTNPMNELVILGAGKIGRMVCHFMSNCGSYKVRIGDASQAATKASPAASATSFSRAGA